MTTTFTNPYFIEFTANGEASEEEYSWAYPKLQLHIRPPGNFGYYAFEFTQDLIYTLKTGESKSVTWKMNLRRDGAHERTMKFIESIIPATAAGPPKSLGVTWSPKVTLPGYPISVVPDMISINFYPKTGGLITLQTGPDFALIKDWYYKEYNYTGTPSPVTPPPETTSIPPTAPSVVPTPTPPVVPTDTPLPTTPTTVEPTVAPTIAPAA